MTELPKWRDPTDPANYPARVRTHHHYLAGVVAFSPGAIRREMARVEGFNAKLAVLVTRSVGTMACAYCFGLLAFTGIPAALAVGGIGPSNWLAEEFLQLVLLSIIMVGQTVLAKASDGRAEAEAANTIAILDEVKALRAELAQRDQISPPQIH